MIEVNICSVLVFSAPFFVIMMLKLLDSSVK